MRGFGRVAMIPFFFINVLPLAVGLGKKLVMFWCAVIVMFVWCLCVSRVARWYVCDVVFWAARCGGV